MYTAKLSNVVKRMLSKETLLAVCLVAVFAVLLLVPDLAFAQNENSDDMGWFHSILWTIVSGVFGLFVGIGGVILNTGINLFVVNFGIQYTQTGLGFVVDQVWVYIRDIFNLLFIFGLVYIGFKMILNSSDSRTKQWLVYLILAALLVNFSLFITKFVIDFSNIAATQLVTSGFGSSVDGTAAQWLPANTPADAGLWFDVAGEFAKSMGLPSIYGGDGPGNIISDFSGGGAPALGYIFGSMILFIIAGIVFVAGGLMLIVRFIVLNIYMLLSPVMFLGWVFPQLEGFTRRYWSGFLGQAFFAPTYILMLYFSFRLLNGYGVNRQQNLAGVFNGSVSANGVTEPGAIGEVVGSLTFFLVVCGFLIASIVVSKKLSEMGANGTMGAVSNINNRIIRTTRKTVETPYRKMAAAPVNGARYGGGYLARSATSNLGNRLDRGLRRIQQNEGKIGKLARRVDRPVGRVAQNLQNARFGLEQTQAQATASRAAVDARARREANLRQGIEAEERIRNGTSTNIGQDQDAVNKMQQAAANLSARQLEDMTRDQQLALVAHVNDSTFSNLMDSEKINDDAKGKILKARQEAIKTSLTENGQLLSGEIEKLSVSQIETLGEDFIKNNASSFTEAQMKELSRSKIFTSAQKAEFNQARGSRFAASSANEIFNSPDRQNNARRRKPTEVASMPKNIVTRLDVARELNSAELRELSKRSDLTTSDRQTIERAVSGNPANADGRSYIGSPHYTNNWT